MESIIKEIKSEEKAVEKSMKKLNIWMIASVVLVIALVAVIAWPSGGVSSAKAGETLLTILNERTGGGVTLNAIKDSGSLFEATVSYQGQEIPVYMTKAGDYVVYQAEKVGANRTVASDASASDNPQAQAAKEVVKSDKPVVDAFVFTYCPYGLQFEKALGPVYDLLKDKADINLVQIGAMHGEYEKVEAFRQLCIQKEYGKDKLWAYLNKFIVDTAIGTCNSDMNCSKPLTEAIMKTLSIDAAKINTCMDKDAQALYDADGAKASSLGASGSPTFIINGAEVSVSRTADAIKKAVCDAFTTAPSECSQNLSTSSATPGFGAGAGAATGASCG